MRTKPKRYEILARVGVDDLNKVKSALTGFEPVSSGSKPDILDRYTIGLRDIT